MNDLDIHTVNHGKQILAEHYAKHHYRAAQRRLVLAFLAVCTIATLYAVFALEVASTSSMFVPK
jgi:hypothetical protein